ncbi:RagB/SusD family nutrient uptake outer membrane protein [Flavobacteriaceae bacterium TK19130]|nr:RagB/SusD family nutrient uptake outer membrane protein [Thermobacterium salinum]
MKNIYKNIIRCSFLALLAISVIGCTFDEVIDPNGPSVDGVEANATIGQLNELVIGVESSFRFGHGTETTASGTMARELYLFNADPRNTGDLLGKNGIGLDNNSFYSTAQWNGSYRCIKNARLLIGAVNNTDAVNETEANGYIGFAKTIIAYELIQMLKSYDRARIDIDDPENLGPILEFGPAMDAIRQMLNEANQNLGNAGSEFVFGLSEGFEGFDTPDTFSSFNRGVAALAAVYDNDGQGALNALNNSFFDLNGDLDVGPKHVFGLGGNDIINQVFRVASTEEVPNNGDQIIVHNSFIEDAEEGDERVAEKTQPRPDPSTQDGLTGTHESTLYESVLSPIDIIRNEELILVYAEASILQNNLEDAETALNIIRNAAGLPDYSGAITSEALTTEMLRQRRYSLWSENHRMFDLRRYGLSNTLPIDREGDQIFNTLPVPLSENAND